MNRKNFSKIASGSGQETDIDQVYTQIFEAIVDHKLAPGTHLKEDDLCDFFGIGRTRIRRVLSRLSADHIVELVNNRGAFVARPSVFEAREVFRARRLIEGHLVRRAAESGSTAVRKALLDHLHHESAAREASDMGAIIKKCGKYHQVLADQADSPIMAHFVRELIARSSLIVAVYEVASPDESELVEHQQLTDLVLEGRSEEAVALMDSHLRGIESRLDLSSVAEPEDDLKTILSRM